MKIKWVLIGEVATSHGNRGEIKVIPHTDFPERFLDMSEVRLFGKTDQEPRLVRRLEQARLHKGAVILKLEGVDSIDNAQALRGMHIKVSTAEVVPLPEGSYYIFQLIGLECVTTTGLSLGRITEVLQTGANDVYVVKPPPGLTDQAEILIPVLPHVVLEVDLERGQVLIELIDGLLE
ncbi:MAG: ribosome maturation factor RimM [Limnochordia bacterium]|jgi:16S rRNA processing protein RimM